MSIQRLFLTMLVILSSFMQSDAVQYTVKNKAGNTIGGFHFSREIGISYSQQTMKEATDFIWRVFQENTPAARKSFTKVSLFIENMHAEDVAYTSNDEIHMSATYLGRFSGGNVKREFTGVFGLIEGFVDFVRLRSGYVPSNWARPGQGYRWDQGYAVTARFLTYCNGERKGFVAKLNKKMRTGYSDNYFVDLLGKSVGQLWKDYKGRYAT
ncbi:hypothetical protein BT93_G0759 [Corymbia citriodora subsp. variegata]|nr:hypothetical protein BT93_G0759 [Corymbia citriodora subsp. variegata]